MISLKTYQRALYGLALCSSLILGSCTTSQRINSEPRVGQISRSDASSSDVQSNTIQYVSTLPNDYHLRKWSDRHLKQVCRPVEDFSNLNELVLELKVKMLENRGVGMAAPQIGDDRRVLVALVGDGYEVFVNPEIKQESGHIPSIEGCLSYPGLVALKMRRYNIEVAYQTAKGEHKDAIFKGDDAIVLQHEIDHLNGKVLFPHL